MGVKLLEEPSSTDWVRWCGIDGMAGAPSAVALAALREEPWVAPLLGTDDIRLDNDVWRDMQWVRTQRRLGADGAFANITKDFAAVLNEEVVGEHDDEHRLRAQLARDKGVSPRRFIVEFLGMVE